MTEAVLPSSPSPLPARPDAAPKGALADLGLALVLVVAAFGPALGELVQYWWATPEYSHGFLMPVVAAWFAWGARDALRQRSGPHVLGVLLLAFSLLLLLLGEMKLSWFLKPYAFVGALMALVWSYFGWTALWRLAACWVALFLMCPLPGRVQEALTVPLKNGAAVLATGLLDASGVPAVLEGNLIQMPRVQDLWVADACSGIRSLIALVSLAVLSCFLFRRPWPVHLLVLAAAVPIAVLVNGLRIYVTGLLALSVGPAAAEGFFHFFEGFALFGVAAALLWGWSALLGRIVGRSQA